MQCCNWLAVWEVSRASNWSLVVATDLGVHSTHEGAAYLGRVDLGEFLVELLGGRVFFAQRAENVFHLLFRAWFLEGRVGGWRR